METENLEKEIARKSAIVYLAITAIMALLFFVITGLMGTYPMVARIGGVMWISLLTLIVSMPLVISYMKKKVKGTKRN
ncbi:MAG: hypothetical protein D9V45_03280 [Chloroflexi bacterium]|nr:hypothetical protein [Anaerolinea sp.]TDA65979.1 MAG: hypothetical protein D9V45_03280 [Chloroflexota bacterium]